MELVKAVTKNERDNIKELYLKAFPKEERKPFSLIVEKQAEGGADMFSIEENGQFAGLAIPAYNDDIVLLVFFAISDTMRGKGCGSKALKLIMDKYRGKRFILEIEDTNAPAPNSDQRIRRKNFYIKNGLINTGLMADVMGVEMEVLGNTNSITFDEYWNVYNKAFGSEISKQIKKVKERK